MKIFFNKTPTTEFSGKQIAQGVLSAYQTTPEEKAVPEALERESKEGPYRYYLSQNFENSPLADRSKRDKWRPAVFYGCKNQGVSMGVFVGRRQAQPGKKKLNK